MKRYVYCSPWVWYVLARALLFTAILLVFISVPLIRPLAIPLGALMLMALGIDVHITKGELQIVTLKGNLAKAVFPFQYKKAQTSEMRCCYVSYVSIKGASQASERKRKIAAAPHLNFTAEEIPSTLLCCEKGEISPKEEKYYFWSGCKGILTNSGVCKRLRKKLVFRVREGTALTNALLADYDGPVYICERTCLDFPEVKARLSAILGSRLHIIQQE